MDRIVQSLQSYIRTLEATPYPNQSTHAALAESRKDLADYLDYLAGDLPESALAYHVREKMSGWVMPEWGYRRD